MDSMSTLKVFYNYLLKSMVPYKHFQNICIYAVYGAWDLKNADFLVQCYLIE